MSASAGMAPSRPPTVKELVTQAELFSFNINIPLKHWIRAAETLYQEVSRDAPTAAASRFFELTHDHRRLLPFPMETTAVPM